MRGIRHGFSATRDYNVGISCQDCLSTENNRLESGSADFVYSCTDCGLGESSANGALSSRVLTQTVDNQIAVPKKWFGEDTLC
jgi:hypothetical protein